MATVRNNSGGALDVPAFNRIVLPDEAVETTNEVAAGFIGQPDWGVELDPTEEEPEDRPGDDDDLNEGE